MVSHSISALAMASTLALLSSIELARKPVLSVDNAPDFRIDLLHGRFGKRFCAW